MEIMNIYANALDNILLSSIIDLYRKTTLHQCGVNIQEVIIMANKKDIKKVVLAYSGGLDTSIIIPWRVFDSCNNQ